ncbi:MAG TPA: AbgT family transporter [Pseudomonadales bacterium]
MHKLLATIEQLGNRIPHPALLFFWLCMAMLLLSALADAAQWQALHPQDGSPVSARSLLSGDGLRFILTGMVGQFIGFAPIGVVLVAMLGIGIAEQSGLLAALLQQTVKRAPGVLLTFVVAFAGIMSSLAADAGYVVLIPLSAMLFSMANRPALAGIATAFAGVSAGYSANLLIGPVDALLAGLTSAAAQMVRPDAVVTASANWYFNVLSTIVLAVLITAVTETRWPATNRHPAAAAVPDIQHQRLAATAVFSLLFLLVLLWLTLPADAPLRNPLTGALSPSPLIDSIVVIIALYFAGAGVVYGLANGNFLSAADIIAAMEDTLRTMAPYLVMMFFAALFIAWFQWSNLGLLLAISGARWLLVINPDPYLLLALFILLSALINLFIGSASAKWALMAPVFVPMLMLAGIQPETSQQAYRIGDSSTNIISPLMPYFALVLGYVQQHQRDAGVGTLVAAMLPYSLIMLSGWALLLMLYLLLGLPLGV